MPGWPNFWIREEREAARRRWLYERVRAAGCAETLRYQHQWAHEEPLPAIPDAVAWCRAKGGEWRRRVEPIIERVRGV